MPRVIHLIEAIAVILGLVIITATFVNLSVAEAAGIPSILDRDSNPFVALAGFTLATLPASRRLLVHAFGDSENISEFRQMSTAMRRIGLLNRVQATNLYLAGLPDESWHNVFADDGELWSWLGEAYGDDALRRQMHPDVERRASMAARMGHVAIPSA